MNKVIYDTHIGATYDSTRKADPEITQLLIDHLSPTPTGHYLDLGCGTGNYTVALAEKGFHMTGLDLSAQMLNAARRKNETTNWVQGSARETPFENNRFDGAMSTLALHLIGNLEKTIQEVYRIINTQGRFVTFTFTPEMIQKYWLCHYFPKCMQKSADKMHSEAEIESAFNNAGFKNIQKTHYFVSKNVTDCFLYFGKHNPERYLDPLVRANISAFSISEEGDEIDQGIASLKQDIESGAFKSIAQKYESTQGDCLIISGQKH